MTKRLSQRRRQPHGRTKHFCGSAARPGRTVSGSATFSSKTPRPHNTWRFYMEQTSDRVLAYAIELTGTERGKIKGNLYELDYAKHYERVKEKELPADTVKLIYEHGEREIPAGQFFNGNPDYELGKFETL